MKRKRIRKQGIFGLVAFIWIIAIILMVIFKIKDNSREVVIKATNTAEVVEEKKEEKEEKQEPIEEKKEEPIGEPPFVGEEIEPDAPVVNHYTTRMTSFYPSENNWENECTASGLCMYDMTENENGWYMYQGKLAIATASARLGASTQKTYKLFQEVMLTINGVNYPAIVVDVCGACQRNNRIDLYVKDAPYTIDTYVEIYF